MSTTIETSAFSPGSFLPSHGLNNADKTNERPREFALGQPPETGKSSGVSLFGDDGFDFSDILDMINPLQHIPIVSTMYRESTGDELGAAPRVAGATLFFGPIGLVSSLANIYVENATGQDIGGHVADWVAPANEDGAPTELATGGEADEPSTEASWSNPDDYVTAWARQEAAWVAERSHAKKLSAPISGEGEPDANHFLQERGTFTAAPTTVEQAASLTEDLRSATWAYEAAANLRSPAPV